MGAAPSGKPGCPDSAFCTASSVSVRIVLIQSWSSSGVLSVCCCRGAPIFRCPLPESVLFHDLLVNALLSLEAFLITRMTNHVRLEGGFNTHGKFFDILYFAHRFQRKQGGS